MFWPRPHPHSAMELRGFWFHAQTGLGISHLPNQCLEKPNVLELCIMWYICGMELYMSISCDMFVEWNCIWVYLHFEKIEQYHEYWRSIWINGLSRSPKKESRSSWKCLKFSPKSRTPQLYKFSCSLIFDINHTSYFLCYLVILR